MQHYITVHIDVAMVSMNGNTATHARSVCKVIVTYLCIIYTYSPCYVNVNKLYIINAVTIAKAMERA